VDGPVNLGNPEELTILTLAQEVIQLTGSKSEIVFHPLPVDDPKVRCPDITKARKFLGWAPETPLRVGMEKAIAYFRTQLAQSRR